MHKLLMTATLLLVSTGIAYAAPAGFPNPFFVAVHMDTGACVVMNKSPNKKFFKSMGEYGSMADAHKAMTGMMECR